MLVSLLVSLARSAWFSVRTPRPPQRPCTSHPLVMPRLEDLDLDPEASAHGGKQTAGSAVPPAGNDDDVEELRSPRDMGGACGGGLFSLGGLFRKTSIKLRRPAKRKHHDAQQADNSVEVRPMCPQALHKAILSANGGRDALGASLVPTVAPLTAPDGNGSAAAAAAEHLTIEQLFETRQLHVRVMSANRLMAANFDGTSDPLISVRVGEEEHRTAVAKRHLDPVYSESFTFLGEAVKQGNYTVELEAWSWDDWHSDDFLGQAEIDLRKLALCANLRPTACTAKLYVLKRNGKKESGDFGELHLAVWTSPQDARSQFLAPGLWGCVANITPEIMSLCAAKKRLPAVHTNVLGTLYEEPCIAYVKVSLVGIAGLVEGLRFPLPPMVCPISGRIVSTLRGAPGCVVRRKLKALAAGNTSDGQMRGGSGGISSGGDGDGGRTLGAGGVPGLAQLAGLRSKVRGMLPTVRLRKWAKEGSMASSASTAPVDSAQFKRNMMGTFRNASSRRGRRQSLDSLPVSFPEDWEAGTQEDIGLLETFDGIANFGGSLASGFIGAKGGKEGQGKQRHPYMYFKLTYAKQTHYSHLKRLNHLGDSGHDESFVFATVRPLVPRPLEVNVYIALNKNRKGKLISRTSFLMTDMILACEAAPRSAPPGETPPDLIKNGKFADEFALPVLRWPLEHLQGQLRMHVGIADADYRALMYKVPLVDPNAKEVRDVSRMMAAFPTSSSFLLTSSGLLPRSSGSAAPTVAPTPAAAASSVTAGSDGGGAGGREPFDLLQVPSMHPKTSLVSSPSDASHGVSTESSGGSFSGASDIDSAWARESARMAQQADAEGSTSGRGGSKGRVPRGRLSTEQAAAEAAAVSGAVVPPPVCAWLGDKVDSLLARFQKDPSVPAPPPPQLMPVGTLFLTVDRVELSVPNVHFFALIKHGPHWCKTLTRHSGKGARGPGDTRHFDMRLPIYDPSDALTATCFVYRGNPQQATRKGKLDVYPFSRNIMNLSGLPHGEEVSRQVKCSRMYKEDGTEFKWEEGQSGHATITISVRLKVVYNDNMRLVKAYVLRPRRPPAWYTLGLDDADQHLIDRQYRKIVSRWLESCSTPLPATCVKLTLATERDKFAMDVLMRNWRRLVSAMEWVLLIRDALAHIMSWKMRCHGMITYILIVCLCFATTPTVAVLLGAAFLAVWGQRRSVGNTDAERRAQEDEADDVDVVAPSGLNPYTDLKRKYDEIVGLGMMVQNYLDDAACFVERLQSMHNWRDPLASAMFSAVLLAATVATYILGLPMVVCCALMWMLRPPVLRDPEPTPIENYFGRLPTLQVLARAARLKQVVGPDPATENGAVSLPASPVRPK